MLTNSDFERVKKNGAAGRRSRFAWGTDDVVLHDADTGQVDPRMAAKIARAAGISDGAADDEEEEEGDEPEAIEKGDTGTAHDPHSGEFTSGPGGGGSASSADGPNLGGTAADYKGIPEQTAGHEHLKKLPKGKVAAHLKQPSPAGHSMASHGGDAEKTHGELHASLLGGPRGTGLAGGKGLKKRSYIERRSTDLADVGHALPDGSFPIETLGDLAEAVEIVKHSTVPDEIRQFVLKRAADLDALDTLPDEMRPRPAKVVKVDGIRSMIALLEPLPTVSEFRVVKAANETRYTLGIAYPANRVDVHGDYMSAEELEQSAWRFAKAGLAANGIQHKDGSGGAGDVVESYIYRGPKWDLNGQVVNPGDWMMGVIWDRPTWEAIRKGKLNGFSIQGFAQRVTD